MRCEERQVMKNKAKSLIYLWAVLVALLLGVSAKLLAGTPCPNTCFKQYRAAVRQCASTDTACATVAVRQYQACVAACPVQ